MDSSKKNQNVKLKWDELRDIPGIADMNLQVSSTFCRILISGIAVEFQFLSTFCQILISF